MNKKQKIFITGANGFIGSHLTERLVSDGFSVRCLVRKTSDLKWLNGLNVEFAYGELTDPESLEKAVSGIDAIVHLGGKTKAVSREEYFKANAIGTENLLRAVLKKSRHLKRFVYMSTQAAAGPSVSRERVRESDPSRPVTLYGESKLAGEKAVMAFSSKIPVAIIRPPTVFGPRDRDVLNLFQTVRRGIRPLLGWKKRFVSVIYIEDLVEGILLVLEKDQAAGQTFFINTEDCLSWQEFGTAIAQALKKKTISVHVPVSAFLLWVHVNDWMCRILGKPTILNRLKIPEFLPRFWISDSSKARRDLGFHTKYGLCISIKKTVEWYKKEGWL